MQCKCMASADAVKSSQHVSRLDNSCFIKSFSQAISWLVLWVMGIAYAEQGEGGRDLLYSRGSHRIPSERWVRETEPEGEKSPLSPYGSSLYTVQRHNYLLSYVSLWPVLWQGGVWTTDPLPDGKSDLLKCVCVRNYIALWLLYETVWSTVMMLLKLTIFLSSGHHP